MANLFVLQQLMNEKDTRIAELEAELEKAALRESNAVAFEIRTQSELQSAHQERDRLREALQRISMMNDHNFRHGDLMFDQIANEAKAALQDKGGE